MPEDRDLHGSMLRIRLVEERIAEEYAHQEMRCPTHLSIGQEAVAAGVCAHLTRDDYAVSGHRAHAHYLAKGGDLRAMLAEIYGKATGCCSGKGGSMHLTDLDAGFLGSTPIVGSTIPLGVGAAFSAAQRGESRVVAVFFGEGAVEEGVFHESVNFAALRRLPVVFVCENNLYSVYTPLAPRQPGNRTVTNIAAGHGIATRRGDGNSVREVSEIAGWAVGHARSGAGPVFLELATYRWREHCGPNFDNDLGYRAPDEYAEWRARCPVETFEAQLVSEGLDPGELETKKRELGAEIDEAFEFARSSAFPEPSSAAEHVYA